MKSFIITAILMALTIGILFGLMFTMSLSGIKRAVVTLLIALSLGSIISGLIVGEAKSDANAWNDGVCPECSEPWHLVNVEHLRHGDVLAYYTCDKCQKVIELHG